MLPFLRPLRAGILPCGCEMSYVTHPRTTPHIYSTILRYLCSHYSPSLHPNLHHGGSFQQTSSISTAVLYFSVHKEFLLPLPAVIRHPTLLLLRYCSVSSKPTPISLLVYNFIATCIVSEVSNKPPAFLQYFYIHSVLFCRERIPSATASCHASHNPPSDQFPLLRYSSYCSLSSKVT